MKKIIALTDYRNSYWSKHYDEPYRSGFDQNKMTEYFFESGYELEILRIDSIQDFREFNDSWVIYTSSEDHELYYKSFIEDIILGISLAGGKIIPRYELLRAHHNKVFMEILRKVSLKDDTLNCHWFGISEEIQKISGLIFPCVVKKSTGATSSGVFLAHNYRQLKRILFKISATYSLKLQFHDLLRKVRHKGYIPESFHRRKFIVQNFIPVLKGDCKVLIFKNKYYVLNRQNRKNDFRASGSGRFIYSNEIPVKLLEYAEQIFNKLDTPVLSLDVAEVKNEQYLIEFQAICFGTYTLEEAPFYFVRENSSWVCVEERSSLEKVFVESIVGFINKQ